MFLAASEIEKIRQNISGLNEYSIQGASIDLCISDKAKICDKPTKIDLFEDNIDDKLKNIYTEVDLAKGYDLKPNSFLYSSSAERVKIPLNMCGIILPRSSFARIGLILPISSYANPGYEGNLPIVIFNASPNIVRIPPYIRIMQLLLCGIKGEAIEYGAKKDAKYQGEHSSGMPSFSDLEIGEILARIRKNN